MRIRYDLTRSDNAPFVGRKSHKCTGDGLIHVVTGFAVNSAIITWCSLPVRLVVLVVKIVLQVQALVL
jgi:hypothetical protein